MQVRIEKDVAILIRTETEISGRPIQTEVNRRLRSTFQAPVHVSQETIEMAMKQPIKIDLSRFDERSGKMLFPWKKKPSLGGKK